MNIRGAALDQGGAQFLDANGKNHSLLEVDLGEMTSIKSNQVHIDQLKKGGSMNLKKGEEVIDDSSLEENRFNLVMVGRRLTQEEYERSAMLQGVEGNQQHMLQNEIFHESAEKFHDAIKEDEGVFMYYFRHLYVVFGMFFGVAAIVKSYSFSFEAMIYVEDYQDQLLFEYIKA